MCHICHIIYIGLICYLQCMLQDFYVSSYCLRLLGRLSLTFIFFLAIASIRLHSYLICTTCQAASPHSKPLVLIHSTLPTALSFICLRVLSTCCFSRHYLPRSPNESYYQAYQQHWGASCLRFSSQRSYFRLSTSAFYALARLGEFTVHLLKAFDPIKHVKRSDMSFDAEDLAFLRFVYHEQNLPVSARMFTGRSNAIFQTPKELYADISRSTTL